MTHRLWRSFFVFVLIAALAVGLAHPDAGLGKTLLVARWVGLRVWYTTQLALRLAARAEAPRIFSAAASVCSRSFPADLIQPRV